MSNKILIIEDEKILSEMYRDKLISEGFEIISAFSAEEGIEILQKEISDLILLDILLPEKNGVDFLREIRKDSRFSSIPVLAFSNYDGPEMKRQAFELGIKDYLIKTDFTPNEIVAKIRQVLSEARKEL